MAYFIHKCTPTSASPASDPVDLTPAEIEEAGIWEVLQAPGAALGSWSLLGALLVPGHTEFVFREPLGRSREVKTALSGLFGRFVARAYASRYLGYRFFNHIFDPPMPLSHSPHGEVRRTNHPGRDMPDWAGLRTDGSMAIIEAKGCHDESGPNAALRRAYNQTLRAEIVVAGQIAPFKRFAIATRWGVNSPKPTNPMIYVKDPDADDDAPSASDLEALRLGIVRRHAASFLRSIGELQLSDAFFSLVEKPLQTERAAAAQDARNAINGAHLTEVKRASGVAPEDVLVGGFISRNGPIGIGPLSSSDQAVLYRIGLAPTYIGIERATLIAAIDGDLSMLLRKRSVNRDTDPFAPTDEVGGWVIRPGTSDVLVN